MSKLKINREDVYEELLARAKETGDQSLIALAESLKPKEESPPAAKKRGRPKKAAAVAVPEKPVDKYADCVVSSRREGANARPDGKIPCKRETITAKVKPMDTGEFKNDKANKILKKFTEKVKKGSRPPSTIKATCTTCSKEYDVSPIHVEGRGEYVCDRCMNRRARDVK